METISNCPNEREARNVIPAPARRAWRHAPLFKRQTAKWFNSHKFLMTKRRKSISLMLKTSQWWVYMWTSLCLISGLSGILILRSLFTSPFKWPCFRCDFCGLSIVSRTLFARFVCRGLFESYTPLKFSSLGICSLLPFKLYWKEKRSEIWLFQLVSGLFVSYIDQWRRNIEFLPRVNFFLAFLLYLLEYFLKNSRKI